MKKILFMIGIATFLVSCVSFQTKVCAQCKSCEKKAQKKASKKASVSDDLTQYEKVKVHLKNGDVVTGKVTERTDKHTYLQLADSQNSIVIQNDSIDRIGIALVKKKKTSDADCYDLGYRHGRCSARKFFGYTCEQDQEIVIPDACWELDSTKKAIEAGVQAGYNELVLNP